MSLLRTFVSLYLIFLSSTASAADAATFVSQSAPTYLNPGATTTVTVTMKNTGTTTWSDATWYKLGAQNPQDNTTWKPDPRVYLAPSDQIAPNQQKAFTFTIKAPTTPGFYNFQWKMVREGVAWFGASTTNLSIQVGGCPGANPRDTVADDTAINQCLAGGGVVGLIPGSPGYYIQDTLLVGPGVTHFTSTQRTPGTEAKLIATATNAPMGNSSPLVEVTGSNLLIDYLIIDGNKTARSGLCNGLRYSASNIYVPGSNVTIDRIQSNNAYCGSALVVSGMNLEIANSEFHNNGFPAGTAGRGGEPWADAITATLCVASIHDNVIIDFTDVGIAVGGGGPQAGACVLQRNWLEQHNVRGFAGIAVANFSVDGQGNYGAGSIISDNYVSGGPNGRIDLGLVAGMHPWDPSLDTHGATITGNTLQNNKINLLVDGFSSGSIYDNCLSAPIGGLSDCNPLIAAANLVIGHAAGSCVQQTGAIRRSVHYYNGGTCLTDTAAAPSVCANCTP